MSTTEPERRIAVFLDYENLAIGARDHLGRPFDFGLVADRELVPDLDDLLDLHLAEIDVLFDAAGLDR